MLPALSLGFTAILLVAGSRAHSAAQAGLTLACSAGVLYVSQSGFWAVSADIAGQNVGVVSAIMNMGGQLGELDQPRSLRSLPLASGGKCRSLPLL